jgi:hypothetical protein
MKSLEPQMFTETFEEDAFVEAPELGELAVAVARQYDEFGTLKGNLASETIRIAYVWETKPFDPSKDEYTPHVIARVRKAPTLWRCLTGYDLVMQFRRWFWQRFTPEQREAVVFHELAHIGFTDSGIELRHHDIEEFNSVVRHFGPAIPGRRAFLAAYMEWQREQLPPSSTNIDADTGEILDAPGPDVLSPAPVAEILAPMQELADRLGGDVTISAGGKSGTISSSIRCPRCDGPLRPGEVHETAGQCEAAR